MSKLTFYGTETRSPDFQPNRFGYTVDKEYLESDSISGEKHEENFHLQGEHDQTTHGGCGPGGCEHVAHRTLGEGLVSASSMITSKPRGRVRQATDTALAAIDSVHAVPEGMVPIPVTTKGNLNAYGAFVTYGVGEYPDRIEIKPTGLTPELTVAHEFGHYLENQVSLGGKEILAVRDALEKTEYVNILRDVAKTKGLAPSSKRNLKYYLQPTEIFARAYSQWIAVRSGNKTMLKQVATVINDERSMYSVSQWKGRDFLPVGKALDALFRSKGMLK